MMKSLVVVLALVSAQLCYAEIKVYESTDNTGINKKEQIEVIEKYLTDLSGQLKNIEAKLEANTVKLKSLETNLSAKDSDIKKIQDQMVVDKKTPAKTDGQKAEASEMEKMKSDILAMKNNDIEPLREDVNAMRFSIKNIQGVLKLPAK
ncbi:MAG: hypothetical protein H7177_12605 [Rhizobacter sp.]|nr:hypothetical protein [Bacteriovorax sp.]